MRAQFGYPSQSCSKLSRGRSVHVVKGPMSRVEDEGSGIALCFELGASLHFRHTDSRIHLELPVTPVVMRDRAGHTLESFDSFISHSHLLGHELRRDYA